MSAAASVTDLDAPIGRALLRLALPVLASQLLRIAFQWVDALWVRGLGVEATAAVTSAVFVMWCVYALNDVFGVGITAYVSQLLGAGERARAGLAAWKGVRASALMGLVPMVAGLTAAPAIYRLMGGDEAMVGQGAAYLSVVLVFAPIPMVALTCESVMRAAGDTRTPLLLDLGAVALNAVLDPLLIYGPGPFPALGIAGAAWATVISQALLAAAYLLLARRRHPALPLARRAPGPPVRVLGMMKVGLPTALSGVLWSSVYLAFARAVAPQGAAALAVIGISNRIEALVFVCAIATGLAGATLVGHNLGAGRPERAKAVIRTSLVWMGWLSLVISLVVFVWPAAFLSLFSRDPEVLRIGVPYLRVLALCFLPTGLELVVAEAVQGSGHTLVVSAIYTVTSLARIPLAFLVADVWGFGALGVAWVITLTCIVRTLVLLVWVARGTWTRGLARELHGPPLPERAEGA